MINYYRRDTSSVAGDSLKYWLQELNTLQSEYALAFEHLKTGEISLMNDVLNEIPNTYDLPGELQFIHNDYLLYFDLLADLSAQGKSIENAGQGQIDTLLLLAAYDQTNPGIYARNALIQSREINYNEPYILPVSNKSVSVMDPFEKQTESGSILKVFPNPAKDYIIVEYVIDIPVAEREQNNFSLVLLDANGKLLKSFELNYSQDQLVISTENLKSGIYVFNLYIYGKIEKSRKFTIVK